MQKRINESDYNLTPLQEEASTRRYFLTRNSEGNKLVLCKDTNGVNLDFIQLSEFLESHRIPVPKVIAYDLESGVTLQEFCGMEDLSGLGLEEYIRRLDTLLEIIHSLQALDPPSLVQSRKFDTEKLTTEVNITWDNLLIFQDRYGWDIYRTEELKIFLYQCCEYLDKHPESVFVHRDFHCRNVLRNPSSIHAVYGDLVLIDFQDARMGTPQYDLCSILYDAYKPLPKDIRIEFLEKFRSKLKDPVRYRETYYIQALQRSFKALGTYLIQVGIKKNPKFKPSLIHALENIKEICQLGHLPDSVYIFADSFLRYKDHL